MASIKRRIFNVTARCFVKHGQARGWVDDGVCAWVEFGVSIRRLTVAEMVQARSQQAASEEPMPMAELPGVVMRGIDDIRREMSVAWQGTLFGAPRETILSLLVAR